MPFSMISHTSTGWKEFLTLRPSPASWPCCSPLLLEIYLPPRKARTTLFPACISRRRNMKDPELIVLRQIFKDSRLWVPIKSFWVIEYLGMKWKCFRTLEQRKAAQVTWFHSLLLELGVLNHFPNSIGHHSADQHKILYTGLSHLLHWAFLLLCVFSSKKNFILFLCFFLLTSSWEF